MTVKISNLPAATSVGSGDVLPVVQSGTTKKIDLNSPWNINIDGGNIDGTPIGVSSASSGAFTTLDATGDVTIADKIVHAGDTNTAIRFPSADTVTFETSGAEQVRIDSNGNVGIGVTPSAWTSDVKALQIGSNGALWANTATANNSSFGSNIFFNSNGQARYILSEYATQYQQFNGIHRWLSAPSGTAGDPITMQERMRIDSSGNVLIGKTNIAVTVQGHTFSPNGFAYHTTNGQGCLYVNRLSNDGTLVSFRQDSSEEGTISVSGTTVSYNGGHLSRWSRLPSGKQDTSILKGTVMTNLDAMIEWGDEDNEQLNQMAVSSVEGDPNVSGVFVNWDNDDDWNDMNIAMTGDMIIRIGAGVTVQRGDLLMSAGDGTAKPQGDDVVKSKTIAKVTSTHVTCTYDDGSYCVPCVLMAC